MQWLNLILFYDDIEWKQTFEKQTDLSTVFKYKTKQKKKGDVLFLYSLSMFILDENIKVCKMVWYEMGLWKSNINFNSLMTTILRLYIILSFSKVVDTSKKQLLLPSTYFRKTAFPLISCLLKQFLHGRKSFSLKLISNRTESPLRRPEFDFWTPIFYLPRPCFGRQVKPMVPRLRVERTQKS